MPKRFIKYSRTDPERTILFIIGNLTWMMQGLFVMLNMAWAGIPNLLLVCSVGGYAVAAAYKNSVKHMSISSFWLFVAWLWSALSRLMFSPDAAQLLWAPMLTVAMVMAVIYIFLSYQKRHGVR